MARLGGDEFAVLLSNVSPAVADAFVRKSASFDALCAVLRGTVAR
jgi:GGDEF domain-containing protein